MKIVQVIKFIRSGSTHRQFPRCLHFCGATFNVLQTADTSVPGGFFRGLGMKGEKWEVERGGRGRGGWLWRRKQILNRREGIKHKQASGKAKHLLPSFRAASLANAHCWNVTSNHRHRLVTFGPLLPNVCSTLGYVLVRLHIEFYLPVLINYD